jgi:hypothetical protein
MASASGSEIPQTPRKRRPLRDLQVGSLEEKIADLKRYEGFYERAVEQKDFADFDVYVYPPEKKAEHATKDPAIAGDPAAAKGTAAKDTVASNDPRAKETAEAQTQRKAREKAEKIAKAKNKKAAQGHSVKIRMPQDMAREMLQNRMNLSDVLDRIQYMLQSDSHDLTFSEQDEFTRLQVLAVQHFEVHYVLLLNFYGQAKNEIKVFENAKIQNKQPERWNRTGRPFPPLGFILPSQEVIDNWDDLRFRYGDEFRQKHITQLWFVQALRNLEPNQLSHLFVKKALQPINAKGETSLRGMESRNARDSLKQDSILAYGSDGNSVGLDTMDNALWCPVSREMVRPELMRCAHIVPFSLRGKANYIFGSSLTLDILNQPENTLMLDVAVEEAMDLGRIAFTPVTPMDADKPSEFRLVILDKSILEDKVLYNWKVSANSRILGIKSEPDMFAESLAACLR